MNETTPATTTCHRPRSSTVCPICRSQYERRAGEKCGDHSQGQTFPCVGRLIPAHEFQRGEWRELYRP
jgi:hypothetical protein